MIDYCYHFSICLYLLLFKIFCKQDMPCLILFSVSKILGRLNMSDLAIKTNYFNYLQKKLDSYQEQEGESENE